ncbi:MAG: hydrogenase formation protein HypD [Pseudomonadales bacterium]|nr:hydrogenase formation protein HypD [Pseudomonadales bacterium]
MKYVDEFRDPTTATQIAAKIKREVNSERTYRIMEFCGGHTHAIFRYGIQDLMPANVNFIHGPGCPVCVLPQGRLDSAIELVTREDVILCTYADLMRVPASNQRSLLKLKAEGGDIRMVYSTQDALKIARQNPQRNVVFFAIGFETTTPATAVAIKQARQEKLTNFSIYCNHVLTPAALTAILEAQDYAANIDAILGPSHVSTIIGSQAYEYFATHYRLPLVIAGFEPLDVMQSTLMLIRQLNENRADVENEYSRAVTRIGNQKAQALTQEVMEIRHQFEWRGLGIVPNSALKIKATYADIDSEQRFNMIKFSSKEIKSCECPAILRGEKRPHECKLFGNVCTPENPIGSCMVSSEGACAAYWSYGRFRDHSTQVIQEV